VSYACSGHTARLSHKLSQLSRNDFPCEVRRHPKRTRHSLLESPLAFLASPEDELASSEAAVRELLDRQRR
jgi:hypothetical protein